MEGENLNKESLLTLSICANSARSVISISRNSSSTKMCSHGPWAAYGCLLSANDPSTDGVTSVIATSPAALLNVK